MKLQLTMMYEYDVVLRLRNGASTRAVGYSCLHSSFLAALVAYQACSKVCDYVDRVRREVLQESLDGVNRVAVCTQLAIRLHHAVVDNFFRFTYSSTGAPCARSCS